MAGTQGYIKLERRFADYRAGEEGEPENLGFFYSSHLYAPHTWPKLLKHRCTVVVGTSGSGKSVEFKQQAEGLRKEGKAAFFCRLEDLANLPLQSALEIGTTTELESWLASSDEGWFFLDAVDEAKLANLRQFEWAINNFVEAIAPHRSRVHIFISTRPHAWEAYGDREMLCRKLDLKVAQEDDKDDKNDDDAAEPDNIVVGGEIESGDAQLKNPAQLSQEILHIVRLVPLGPDHIRIFAKALGVGEIEAFMEEVEKANADVFANRPADLPGLFELWRTTKRIGRYSDVVLQNITTKLKEVNPRHLQSAALSPDRALVGAERLAAAVTMCRKSSLLLPDRSPLDANVRGELIDPKDVLLNWRPVEVQELLGCGIFDESLYGSVRFHHRTSREYLAARWLRRLLGQQKHRRSVKRMLFVQPYGSERVVVVPSLKAVAAWLALWDQDIRDTILRVDPKLLLEFGDASPLTIEIRAGMLRDFAARYAKQQHTPLEMNLRELRRLADQRLVPAVKELLAEYPTHNDVRHLLLRLVREGKLQGCADIALGFVGRDETDGYSRICGIQIIAASGTAEEKGQLKRITLDKGAPKDRALLAAVIHALYPAQLSIEEIGDLLEKAPHGRDSAYDELQRAVIALIEHAQNYDDVLKLHGRVVRLLRTPPLVGEWCRISSNFAWLIPTAMAAAKIALSKQESGPVGADVLSTIAMAAQSSHLDLYTGDVHKGASELLTTNRGLRHAVFWYEVEQRRIEKPGERVVSPWMVTMESAVEHLDLDDAPTLLEALRGRPLPDDRLIALSRLVTLWARNGRPTELMKQTELAVEHSEELKSALKEHLAPPAPEGEAIQRRMSEFERRRGEEEAEREKRRQEGIEYLKANVGTLVIGDHAKDGRVLSNINYLRGESSRKLKNNSRWSVAGWRQLEPEFGPAVAKAFRDYCVNYWRLYQPQLRSEIGRDTNQTPGAVIIGLSGLAMEAAGDRSWTTKLSKAEAALATRYALWELNGLPGWFGALFEAHSDAVKEVLVGEMAWELTQPRANNSAGYLFSRLRWTSTGLGSALRAEILTLLERNPEADAAALGEALTVVLRNREPLPSAFAEMATQWATAVESDEVKALWLSALLCVDAEKALEILEGWVAEGADAAAKERRLSLVLEHVWGDSFHGLSPEHQSFRRADLLVRLIKLSHVHIDPEKDLVHEGGFSPGLRDHAQDARNQLVKILCELPGRETYHGLLELSEFHPKEYPKDRMLVLAERRAEADTEPKRWAAEDVQSFAASAEYGPRSQKELFELALSRLDDIKLELEEGDESEASLLRRVQDEPELRKVMANRLRRSAGGKYTTGSEEELADASRADIRLHHPDVEARVPIEIKSRP